MSLLTRAKNIRFSVTKVINVNRIIKLVNITGNPDNTNVTNDMFGVTEVTNVNRIINLANVTGDPDNTNVTNDMLLTLQVLHASQTTLTLLALLLF